MRRVTEWKLSVALPRMAEKVRHSGLDIVRSTAILLVILQHSWSGLDLDVPSGAFSYWFYAPWMIGVPLFVMLSGALNLRRTQDPGDFLGKRFKRVLIPFLIWGTGVYILSALLGKYPQVDSLRSGVGYYFVALLEGGINQAYWFIYLLLGLYLITPVLQRAFDPDRPHSRRLLEYCLWLWVGVEICKEIYPSFLLLRYLAFPADLFLGYYLAGCYIFRYVPQGRMRSRYGLVGFLLSLCLNWILTAKGNPVGFVQISEAVCLFQAAGLPEEEIGLNS